MWYNKSRDNIVRLTGALIWMDEKKIIEITDEDDVKVVSFAAESISAALDVEQVASELREFVLANKPTRIVVDFDGVKFFSSQILGLLVDVWRKLQNYGGFFVISGINPQLNRVFKITNLDKIFEFYPDRAGAVRAIRDKL